jgi:hypothetical protein
MKEKFNLLLLLLLPAFVFGTKGSSEYKRVIVKEFSNNQPLKIVSVANKYGKVVIHTWSKNSVKATITITGFGKNVDEAKETCDMADVAANFSGGVVTLQTTYKPGGSGSKWFSWGSSSKDSKDYVNIDYDVYVPEELGSLRIDNNFGDVITDVLSFPADISMNYCNYDIKEAQKPLELKMNYCQKGKIGKADRLIIKANYSNVRADAVSYMQTSSNYCEYVLGTVGKIDVKSNYDDYTISRVGSIGARCTYSDFHITEVQGDIDAHLTYGDMNIKTIGQGFKGAELRLTYADVKLGLQQNVNFQVKANLVSGSLKTGELSLKNVTSVKKSSQLSYTAFSSGGGEQSPLINVQGVYSDISLNGR